MSGGQCKDLYTDRSTYIYIFVPDDWCTWLRCVYSKNYTKNKKKKTKKTRRSIEIRVERWYRHQLSMATTAAI